VTAPVEQPLAATCVTPPPEHAPTAGEALLHNTLWYGLATAGGLLSGLLTSVLLARGLGPTRMGEFSYVLWATRTLTAFASLGFSFAIVRYTAASIAKHDRALAWGFVRHLRRGQFLATTIVAGAAIPAVIVLAPDSLRWPLVVACLTLFPLTLETVYQYALYGAQRYDLSARVSTVKMALQLGATTLLIGWGGGVLGLTLAILGVTIVSAWLQRRHARGLYTTSPAPIPGSMQRELRGYLVPLSVVTVLDALVWDRSEVFFLELRGSAHDIAFYSLAFGLATKAMIVPDVAVGALLPTFAALHGEGALAEFQRVYRTALRNVALASAPIAALLVGVAPGLVRLLYGTEYLPVAPLLSTLIGVALFASLRRVAWAALRGAGDRRCAVTATSIAAILNVGAAAWLVGPLGSWGAVVANSAAQMTATVWALTVMARTYRCGLPWRDFGKIGLAAATALVVTLAVGADGSAAHLAVALFAGGATFAIACRVLRIIAAEEWSLLLGGMRRFTGRPALPLKGTGANEAGHAGG
jgi:O-antigen/teichoic acid export membrane protein